MNTNIVRWNKEAYKKYIIEETYEMGISLNPHDNVGLSKGKIDVRRAWCTIKHNELYIRHLRILGGAFKNEEGSLIDPDRKLLEERETLDKIFNKVYKNRMVIVPIKAYTIVNDKGRRLLKITVGIGKKNPNYVPTYTTKGTGKRFTKRPGYSNKTAAPNRKHNYRYDKSNGERNTETVDREQS